MLRMFTGRGARDYSSATANALRRDRISPEKRGGLTELHLDGGEGWKYSKGEGGGVY